MKHLSMFLSLFLLTCVAPVLAQTASVTAKLAWSIPTLYTDGTAIGSAPVAFNVYQGTKGAVKPKVASVAAGSLTTSISSVAPGTCFNVTSVVNGIESAYSSEACVSAAPAPPAGITVTVVITP